MEALIGRGVAMVVLVVLIVGVVVAGIKLKGDSVSSSQASILMQISGALSKVEASGTALTTSSATDIIALSTQFNPSTTAAIGNFGGGSNITCPSGTTASCGIVLPSGAATTMSEVASASPVPGSVMIQIAAVGLSDCNSLLQSGLSGYLYTDAATPTVGCASSLSTPGKVDIAIR